MSFGSTSTPRFKDCGAPSTEAMLYTSEELLAKEGKRRKKYAAQFTSCSSRFGEPLIVEESGPSPGSYNVKTVTKKTPSSCWSRSRSQRFVAPKNLDAPPPSRYRINRFGDNRPQPVETPRGTIAFGSTSARF
eukprot:TRINITY_DN22457_c0_g1_i1.p1 TRINITY_DN22457_c0_g1~~TRINITY_DN22457_c0_g1_i1.p1  ORF type:complete len:133 (+),score=1.07 TRINITY_DN22457_c0_g1_i1:45-443(+)